MREAGSDGDDVAVSARVRLQGMRRRIQNLPCLSIYQDHEHRSRSPLAHQAQTQIRTQIQTRAHPVSFNTVFGFLFAWTERINECHS